MKHYIKYYIIKFKIFIVNIINYNKPIDENKIIVDNFLGKGYGDNAKYIIEKMYSNNPNLKIIWIVNDMNLDMPKYITKIKYNSFKSFYEYSTAKIWIDNVRNNQKPKKKNNQIYLQTWHGPFGSKKIEKMAEKVLSKLYIKEAKKDGIVSDAILSNSKMQDEQYLNYFWLNNNVEILKFGFPRNDYLINNKNNTKLKKEIREKLKLDNDAFVILYAPTFRDDYSIEGYDIEFENVVKTFEKIKKKKSKLLVRLHPNVQEYSKFIKYNDDVINVTSYPSMQDLSLISNCIISDYSSTLFDFAIQEKPAFICALDLEKYKNTRGLVDEYFKYPFPFAKTNKELLENIERFDDIEYKKNINSFFKQYPIYDDGMATINISNWIENKMNENK